MSNALAFVSSFNVIDEKLREIAGVSDPRMSFPDVLKKLSNYRPVKDHNTELYTFNSLRNAIVHKFNEREEIIAEPNQKWLKKIQDMEQMLVNPKTAYDVSVKNITHCKLQDNLKIVLQTMKDNNYSICPVYDEHGKIISILSEYSLLKFMAANSDDSTIINTLTVNDIKDYLDEPNDKDLSAAYLFISKNEMEYKLEDLFADYISQRVRINAIFITHNGKPDEGPIGMFTSWDLPSITN